VLSEARIWGWRDDAEFDVIEDDLEDIIGTPHTNGVKPVSASVIDPFQVFTAQRTPPEYIWHRILQKGCLYALTARWGHGKTAIMLSVALHAAVGKSFGGRRMLPCKVLYLCGENPDDARLRAGAGAMKHGIDPTELADRIYFTKAPFAIDAPGELHRFVKAVTPTGPFDLLVIDTGPAHSGAEEENANREMHELAMGMRKLMAPLGNPATVALMHPTKDASKDNLQPRGGGAFSGSIDGELCAWAEGGIVEFFHRAKFRGPGFTPMCFELVPFDLPGEQDNFGEPVTTVVAIESAVRTTGAGDKIKGKLQQALWSAIESHYVANTLPPSIDDIVAQSIEGEPSRYQVIRARRAVYVLAGQGLIEISNDRIIRV
jgi:hypothetical protein